MLSPENGKLLHVTKARLAESESRELPNSLKQEYLFEGSLFPTENALHY